jgi:tetratricopeptide (TPR) repeat protein
MRRSTVLAVLLAGCTSTPSPSDPVRPEPPPTIQAQSPEWAKIAEEAMKGRPVEEQQRMLEAERRYQLALAWFNRGDFDKAKVEAQLAVQQWPEHLSARHLLDDVNEIIIGGPARIRGIGEQELRVARVTVDQARLEIENHLLQGKRYLNAQLYTNALREFESAEFKIRNLPYDLKPMNDLLPGVRELKARAKSSLKD